MPVPDPWDTLHSDSPPGAFWSTANIGEAVPGVCTPLSWSLWGWAIESSARRSFHGMGAASRRESRVPVDPERRFVRAFHGRGAAQVDFLCGLADRVPGTSGAALAEQMFGYLPAELDGRPTRRRYPLIAARMPWMFLRMPGRLSAAARDTASWYAERIGGVGELPLGAALAVFAESAGRFRHNTYLQGATLFCVVQPMYELLGRLVAATGVGDVTSLASGFGGVPETAVVADLWRASRGALSLADVVARHGFHGPGEGELSARVWREDDTPLRRTLSAYEDAPDTDDPAARELRLRETRLQMEAGILAALPAVRRPVARWLLRTAARAMPLRGSAKNAFLQAFDLARASARRAGELLAEDGLLEAPDDVFQLTEAELLHLPADAKDLVSLRRERREVYLGQDLPRHWRGRPEPLAAGPGRVASALAGVGVSAGVVEGTARVVLDPAEDVDPGHILVAPTTDPSWASIMFVSEALVVDIGGALSHAAIVARELGIPCVVNTLDGSRVIRDGDRLRVDGGTGTVTILGRAAAGSSGRTAHRSAGLSDEGEFQ